jgi:hypothetical protein
MDLVTVTCERDMQQMILQAESIQKFLAPCTHWVVLNDRDADTKKWQDLLEPYYTNHTLKIWNPNWYSFENINDWDKQQIYKFTVSQFLDDDYVILDSKNFFIQPCNINDWRGILGCGFFQRASTTPNWNETSNFYAKSFGVQPLDKFLSLQTPFVFEIGVIRSLGDIDSFAKKFNYMPVMASEFLYYSYLVRNQLRGYNPRCLHKTVWPTDYNKEWKFDLENLHQENPKAHVLGLHRSFLMLLSDLDLDIIHTWLESKGLSSRLTI